jgi:hypothetical protein
MILLADFESHITTLTQQVMRVHVQNWNLRWRGADIGTTDKIEMLAVGRDLLGNIQARIAGDIALLTDLGEKENEKKIVQLTNLFNDTKREMETTNHIDRLLNGMADDGGDPVPVAAPANSGK